MGQSEGIRIQTYEEFWNHYLHLHAKRGTRLLHTAGIVLGILVAGAGVLAGHPWFLLLGVAAGYAFAISSHLLIEKNLPATPKYPLWAFISDFRMAFGVLIGKL